MKDREFLMWIHARLTDAHGESPITGYMHKLRAVIRSIPADQETTCSGAGNSLRDLQRELAKEQDL